MGSIVYAAPYQPPIPDAFTKMSGLRHTWTGWDGSIWDLSDPSSGVFLMDAGIEGLGMPDIIQHTHDSPVVHGLMWDDFLVTGRKVFWSIGVYHDQSSEGWVALDRAFWRTMRPGKTGVWTVENPSGESLSITLRFASDGGLQFDVDPVLHGWQAYGVTLFPEQPFWEGKEIIQSWASATPSDFYGAAGFSPDFTISESSQISTARLTNPGDMESYIEWTIIGPTTTVSVGVNGGITSVPFAIAEGSTLVINTDPKVLSATLDGNNVMSQLGQFDYRPLPAGDEVALSLAMDGSGQVQAAFTPLYLRGL